MKPDIWMPVYIGDYIKDTQELSAEEHGAYLLLLMHYWLKDGEIGNDIDRLSRVTKCDVRTTQYILDTFFIKSEAGYKNKRADEEIEAAKKRSGAARGNVSMRWGENDNKRNRAARLKMAREKGTHTKEEWETLKNNIGHCLMCGSTEDIVKDHIIPIYQGGSDSIENIQPLCRHCNASKGPDNKDLRPPDWRNLFLTPTERLRNACSSSSSSSSSSKTNSKIKTRDTANAVSLADPLYTAVWTAFISRQPDKKFSDYGKEGSACKQVCKKIRARASPGDEMGLAEKIISCYYEYVMGSDRFWSSQPFTPMGLNTGNRFDSVIKRVYEEETR